MKRKKKKKKRHARERGERSKDKGGILFLFLMTFFSSKPMSLKPVLRAAFFARITGFSIATIYQRPPPSLKTSIFLKKSSTKYVFSKRKHSERQLMRFDRKSKIILKNDKSIVQVGELLFVPQISFSQKSAPSKKKLQSTRTTRNEKKKTM